MEFGEKLRLERKKAGLSQAALAHMVGITTRSLQYYESGQRRPQSNEIVKALAEQLGITAGELAESEHGTRTADQAAEQSAEIRQQLDVLLREIAELMNGGALSEEDGRAFMCAVNDIYFDCRRQRGLLRKTYRVEDYLEQK